MAQGDEIAAEENEQPDEAEQKQEEEEEEEEVDVCKMECKSTGFGQLGSRQSTRSSSKSLARLRRLRQQQLPETHSRQCCCCRHLGAVCGGLPEPLAAEHEPLLVQHSVSGQVCSKHPSQLGPTGSESEKL